MGEQSVKLINLSKMEIQYIQLGARLGLTRTRDYYERDGRAPLYQKGDILLCMEGWRLTKSARKNATATIEYRADSALAIAQFPIDPMPSGKDSDRPEFDTFIKDTVAYQWNEPESMPWPAIRLVLKVISVETAPLQDVTEEWARVEGFLPTPGPFGSVAKSGKDKYRQFWAGKKTKYGNGNRWDENRIVERIRFEVVQEKAEIRVYQQIAREGKAVYAKEGMSSTRQAKCMPDGPITGQLVLPMPTATASEPTVETEGNSKPAAVQQGQETAPGPVIAYCDGVVKMSNIAKKATPDLNALENRRVPGASNAAGLLRLWLPRDAMPDGTKLVRLDASEVFRIKKSGGTALTKYVPIPEGLQRNEDGSVVWEGKRYKDLAFFCYFTNHMPFVVNDILIGVESWRLLSFDRQNLTVTLGFEHIEDFDATAATVLRFGQHESREENAAELEEFLASYAANEVGKNRSHNLPFPASRVFLKVKNIKIARLQDVNENWAVLEGYRTSKTGRQRFNAWEQYKLRYLKLGTQAGSKSATLWEENPYVERFEFEQIEDKDYIQKLISGKPKEERSEVQCYRTRKRA